MSQTILKEIAQTVTEFQEVLAAETKSIKEYDLHTFSQMSSRKMELARRYHRLGEKLGKSQVDIKKLPEEDKNKLQQLKDGFKTALQENAKALENSKHAVERLVQRITSIACETADRRKQKTYTSLGHLASKGSGPVSTVIDQA